MRGRRSTRAPSSRSFVPRSPSTHPAERTGQRERSRRRDSAPEESDNRDTLSASGTAAARGAEQKLGSPRKLCEAERRGMPYATNGQDGTRVYFEDEAGGGTPVVLHDGFGDSVEDLREWKIAQALPAAEFRLIYVDHRGHGRSDRPHDPDAYEIRLRTADAVAVLDQLRIERAHFIGRSWGGRLCFGIGEHAAGRVRSLVI